MIFFYSFAALIFLEIAVFIMAGGAIGFLPTLLLFFGAGVVGVMIVQHQGLGLLARLKSALDRGLMPMDEMFDGACLMAAGLLLFLPGFLSDIIAFILLIPVLRGRLRAFLSGKFGVEGGTINPDTGVIEGEFIRVREEITPLKPPRADL